MKNLQGGDTIPYGIYSGKRLRDVVKKFGRKVLLEIVKCNEVDDDFLKKYHYHHPATEEEKRNWELKQRQMVLAQNETSVSASVEEPYVTSETEELAEVYQDQKECQVCVLWEDSVLYDPEDDPEDSKSYHPAIKECGDYPLNVESIGSTRCLIL